jgi:hypothetical protein
VVTSQSLEVRNQLLWVVDPPDDLRERFEEDLVLARHGRWKKRAISGIPLEQICVKVVGYFQPVTGDLHKVIFQSLSVHMSPSSAEELQFLTT